MKECDVLVVGAGPAGSGAARASALAGARTLMVDKKKEIGTPVQCGEVIGTDLVKRSGMRIPENAIVSRQGFTRFVLGREVTIDNSEPYWRGVTVERKIFDKYLAFRAGFAGAAIQAGHQAPLGQDGRRFRQKLPAEPSGGRGGAVSQGL